MARWRAVPPAGIPERLCRFVPSEWPARCPHEALELWELACISWLKAEPGRSLPFGEHGDVIDVLNYAERHERHRGACPRPQRGA